MPRIVRLRPHPVSGIVLIDVPRDLNELMGSFGPAVLSVDSKGYLCAETELETFATFAAARDLLIVDERPTNRPRQQLVECARCHTAARPTEVPDYCPECGAVFVPATPDESDAGPFRTPQRKCPGCGRNQPRGRAYCSGCGKRLTNGPARLADSLDDVLPTGEAW